MVISTLRYRLILFCSNSDWFIGREIHNLTNFVTLSS